MQPRYTRQHGTYTAAGRTAATGSYRGSPRSEFSPSGSPSATSHAVIEQWDSLDRYRVELEDDLRRQGQQNYNGGGGFLDQLGTHSPRPRAKGENTDMPFRTSSARRSNLLMSAAAGASP
ncbi:unnamed protein product, partial [Amoebophrya sp. A25]|eukprot:GSA25T00013325001.1